MLGEKYSSYKNALKFLNMKTLKMRRSELCLTFAKKSFKSDKFSNWFTVNSSDFDKTRIKRDEL